MSPAVLKESMPSTVLKAELFWGNGGVISNMLRRDKTLRQHGHGTRTEAAHVSNLEIANPSKAGVTAATNQSWNGVS